VSPRTVSRFPATEDSKEMQARKKEKNKPVRLTGKWDKREKRYATGYCIRILNKSRLDRGLLEKRGFEGKQKIKVPE